jgi:hypothetical protein
LLCLNGSVLWMDCRQDGWYRTLYWLALSIITCSFLTCNRREPKLNTDTLSVCRIPDGS